MVDAIETKRARPPDSQIAGPARPADPTPSSADTLEWREDWSRRFVAWFLAMTGGDVHPDGGPVGHRWRLEYFECVRDPQAFEKYAENEIEAYDGAES